MGLIADWPGFGRALIIVILPSESCPTKPVLYYITLTCCPSISSSNIHPGQRRLNKMGLQRSNINIKVHFHCFWHLTECRKVSVFFCPITNQLCWFSSRMFMIWAKFGITSSVLLVVVFGFHVMESVNTEVSKESSPHVWLLVSLRHLQMVCATGIRGDNPSSKFSFNPFPFQLPLLYSDQVRLPEA